jgi:hypothetical protein
MKSKLFAAALLVLTPLLAQAVSVKGDRSFSLFGNGSSDDDFNTSTFGASADLGYSLTDSQNMGVRQDVNVSDFENDNRWIGATHAYYDLEFISLPRSEPYIGVNAGYEYGDGVDESFIGGPEVGLPFYVKPKTFIEARVAYQIPFDNVDEAELAYSLGIGFNF